MVWIDVPFRWYCIKIFVLNQTGKPSNKMLGMLFGSGCTFCALFSENKEIQQQCYKRCMGHVVSSLLSCISWLISYSPFENAWVIIWTHTLTEKSCIILGTRGWWRWRELLQWVQNMMSMFTFWAYKTVSCFLKALIKSCCLASSFDIFRE